MTTDTGRQAFGGRVALFALTVLVGGALFLGIPARALAQDPVSAVIDVPPGQDTPKNYILGGQEEGDFASKKVTLHTISPYIPSAAVADWQQSGSGVGVGPSKKWFRSLDVAIKPLWLATADFDTTFFIGDVDFSTAKVESTEQIDGSGIKLSFFGGLLEASISRLSGKIKATSSKSWSTGSITPAVGVIDFCSSSGCKSIDFITTADTYTMEFTVTGKVEILELDLMVRLARLDIALGDGVTAYVAIGGTVSIEEIKIDFDDGRSISGTSVSGGVTVEAGIGVSESVRISTSATQTLTGSGSDVERDDGTFFTAGVTIDM